MLGYEQISLEEDEFTTQWKAIATEEERDSFLKEHTSIMTDAGELTLSGQSIMRIRLEKQRTIPIQMYCMYFQTIFVKSCCQ